MKLKVSRYFIIIIILIAIIISLSVDYYLPSILSAKALQAFSTSEIGPIINVILGFVYNICGAAIITIFVVGSIQKRENREYLFQIDKKIEEIQRETFKSTFGQLMEPDIWLLLEEQLFMAETIRRNLYISIRFIINDDNTISEKMIQRYDEYNRSNKDIEHKIIISTADRHDRVVLERATSIDLTDVNSTEHTLSKDPVSIISKHTLPVKIKKDHIVRITNHYSINLGMKGKFYQNAIGYKEFVSGIHIEIEKPKGYLFTIELFSKKKLSPTHSSYEDKSQNVKETFFSFDYSGAIFPGTGIEYTLENMDVKEDEN